MTLLRDAPHAQLLLTLDCKRHFRNYEREKGKSAVASVAGDTPPAVAISYGLKAMVEDPPQAIPKARYAIAIKAASTDTLTASIRQN